MGFCKEFNAKTKDQAGTIFPVVITVYADRSFTFILKSPPAAVLLKKAAGLAKGSGEPNRNKVGKVTRAQVLESVKIEWTLVRSDPTLGCPGGWAVASVVPVPGSGVTRQVTWVF